MDNNRFDKQTAMDTGGCVCSPRKTKKHRRVEPNRHRVGPKTHLCSSASNPGAPKSVAVIVAHPDDETLWCGGQLIQAPQWSWHVVTLCRAHDLDRAPRFHRVMRELGAAGSMGDLDDEPEQIPLEDAAVEQAILDLLPDRYWDRIYTHGPTGEYTRHRRHEECCRAVVRLWQRQALRAHELWMFAYTDDNRSTQPHARDDASLHDCLPDAFLTHKRSLITELYGFAPSSWEAQIVPREEGFWQFTNPTSAIERIQQSEMIL